MEYLIIGGIAGVICALIASGRGRSPVAWFFIGFLVPLLALILVLVLPNLKEQERQRAHAAEERRRLQEQLRQERMKNESFRQYAGQRFDAHDRALGVDTRTALGAGAVNEAPALPPEGTAPPSRPRMAWFYEHQGKSHGPVPASRLRDLLRAGTLTQDTLVWSDGDADWRPLSQVEELRGPTT